MSKNLKIILSVFGVLVLLGGVGGGIYLVQRNQTLQEQASPATNLSISPASQSKNPGDSVSFTVNADTQTNSVVGFDLDIVYDPAVLAITSIQKGSFAAPFETEIPGNTTTLGHYKYHFGTQDSTKALHGSGDIAVISASVKADASAGAVTNISFGSGTLAAGIGEGGVNVLVGKSGAQLTVAGVESPSPSPSTVATVAPSPTTAASTAPTPTPSTAASTSPSTTPSTAATPTPTPGGGGTASAAPTPTPSTAAASSAPRASSTPASSTPAASSAPATTTASTKPTVTIPTSGTITAGSTISGTAAPNSTVTIVIKSQTITTTVKADSTGKWSYKIPTTLENGNHTITITDSRGTTTKSFKLTGGTEVTATASALPATGAVIPTIFGISLGVILLFAGLVLAL